MSKEKNSKEKTQILIVEDNIITAMALEITLKKLGYHTCKLVTTGKEAIQIADKECPDLIIMDINLADQMDGIRAAEIIRKEHDIPILFLTGYLDADIFEKANIVKESTFIVKPSTRPRIYKEIEKLLSDRKSK